MFTIKKSQKIQVLFNKEENKEEGSTEIINTKYIDSLRCQGYVRQVREKIANKIEAITAISSSKEIEGSIDKYFPKRGNTRRLNKFLKTHKHIYPDIIRVVYEYRKNDAKQGWYIPEEDMNNLRQLFLFSGRERDVGGYIEDFVKIIATHQDFIPYCTHQPSLLDVGSDEFCQLESKLRKRAIRKLIQDGLIRNIEGCNDSNVNEYFSSRVGHILDALNDVYGTNTQGFKWCRTIDQMTETLEKSYQKNLGNQRKIAWKILQGFYAWGDILEIKERYAELLSKLGEIPRWLKKRCDITITDIKTETDKLGNIIYTGYWQYDNQTRIVVSWRAKRPKSILQKKVETPEYGHTSAIRDSLGMSFSYPDDISREKKQDIMIRLSVLMPDGGYVLKNKGEIGDIEDSLLKSLKEKKKSPLYTDSRPGGDPRMRNASMSGFTEFGGKTCGFEIQFSTESAMRWKKDDDIRYKPRGFIAAIMRGSHQATPQEVINGLPRWIEWEHLGLFGVENYAELLIKMIEEGNIIPCIVNHESKKPILFLTTKSHKEAFFRKWSQARVYLGDNDPHKEKIFTYIRSLRPTH